MSTICAHVKSTMFYIRWKTSVDTNVFVMSLNKSIPSLKFISYVLKKLFKIKVELCQILLIFSINLDNMFIIDKK